MMVLWQLETVRNKVNNLEIVLKYKVWKSRVQISELKIYAEVSKIL